MTKRTWHRRLSVQMLALLTLALLPVGSVALFQTSRVAVEAERTASTALLGLTERAARAEQSVIERAVGAARLFGSMAPELLENTAFCEESLTQFVESNPDYSFIGLINLDGIAACSSASDELDLSAEQNVVKTLSTHAPTVVIRQDGLASNQSVFVVSEPVFVDGVFSGLVSVSIPHYGLPDTTERLENFGLVELVTFNDQGTILTNRSTQETAAREMPAGQELSTLSIDEAQTFRAFNKDGVERRYSIVASQSSPAAVMAVWRVDDTGFGQSGFTVAPAIFPILMWFASMAVALMAVHTLVLRHLSRIRKRMDKFADTRETYLPKADRALIPLEIEEVENNFSRMSQEVLRDEAVLENALREKSVLIKEIHHRVKNNLQLISSIMNMQIRAADHEDTKTVLRRVQDRVLSLATIHRDLYQSQNGGRVNVGALVSEIVEKSAELVSDDGSGLTVKTDIQDLLLYPDQAVPLSLLVSEAMTNAIKYIGDPSADEASIEVSLSQEGSTGVLTVTNSIGESTNDESTGLGSKLMRAFAMQLGGQIELEKFEDQHVLRLRFEALEFQPEGRDF